MADNRPGRPRLLLIGAFLLILCLGIALVLETLFILLGGSMTFPFGDLGPVNNNKVGVIYVEGALITDNVAEGSGYASSVNIVKDLRDAENDKSIKAIVLRVDSPGGTPVAAQEIYEQVEKTRQVKPVVVSMGDMATSAAYYISAPCDWIVANPDSFTGSIGVIWTFQNRSKFYEEQGTEYYVAKSGPYKDVGGDWRGLSDDEKAYVNGIINESYDHFVRAVAQGRNMSYEDVRKLADGRAYTGEQAKQLGLVDEIGGLYDAIDIAARLGSISGTPEVTYVNQPATTQIIIGGQSGNSTAGYYDAYPGMPYGRLYM